MENGFQKNGRNLLLFQLIRMAIKWAVLIIKGFTLDYII